MGGRPEPMEAMFPGTCAWCLERIAEGDSIALLEEDGDWVHERCAEEADAEGQGWDG